MILAKTARFTALFLAGFIAWLAPANAQLDNKSEKVADSRYFSIYARPPIDAYSISSRLNFDYLVSADSLTNGAKDSQAQILVKAIDGLFQEVSDIIDIHLLSFKGAIHFVPDRQSLASLIKQEFGQDFKEVSGYYFERNTIYISLADLDPVVLGREIAHAIISNYFLVPPPPRIREILSNYIEESLNKPHGF
jgi:hypothetical protein